MILFCLLLYLHHYTAHDSYSIQFELWFVRFISYLFPWFLGPCSSLLGFLVVSISLCSFWTFALLLSLWNQDWYWWLKLPIFGCIVTIWFGAARSQSLMIFPYSQNMLPFLEQCTMRSIPVTCDCYMLEKEFRNHPLQSETCNKTKSTKFPVGYRMKSMKSTKFPLYAA